MSAPDIKKSVLEIHESTLPALSEVERFFLDKFVSEGRAVIVKDAAGA